MPDSNIIVKLSAEDANTLLACLSTSIDTAIDRLQKHLDILATTNSPTRKLASSISLPCAADSIAAECRIIRAIIEAMPFDDTFVDACASKVNLADHADSGSEDPVSGGDE